MSDHNMPDPDAVAVRIGCDHDNEAETVIGFDPAHGDDHSALVEGHVADDGAVVIDRIIHDHCPTCGGSGNLIGQPTPTSAADCPTCHGTGQQSDAHSAWWLRTSSGKAGHAPRHLVRDAGGGMYIAACGLERPSSMWRDAGGAKVCGACYRTPQGRAACDAELDALFPESLCDSNQEGVAK